MKKKLFVSMLTVLLVLTALPQMVFADILDDIKNAPNAIALITVDNENCRELLGMEGLQLHVTSEGTDIDVVIPVEKVTEEDGTSLGLWLGTPSEKISDAVMQKLAEIQGELDLAGAEEDPEGFIAEIERLLTNFTITVEGLPEGHFISESGAVIVTHEILRQVLDMIMEAAKEEFGEVESFSALFKKILEEAGIDLDEMLDTSTWTEEDWEILAEMGMTPADIEAMKELIAQIDPLIAYLTSEEFSGILFAGAVLYCECPEWIYYSVEHRYYERVGGKLKLVATVQEGEASDYYTLEGMEGEVIAAKNFKQPVYQGRTYTYLGSYDDAACYDDYQWQKYKLDSFVLGDEDYYGLVLRYVYEKDGSGAAGDSAGTDNGQAAPPTGDATPLGVYVLILAVSAEGIAVLRKKRLQ